MPRSFCERARPPLHGSLPHLNATTIASHDEWTTLREVIVGRIDGFMGFQLDSSFNLFCWDNLRAFVARNDYFKRADGEYEWPVLPLDRQIVDELAEDIDGFVTALEVLGVRVRRPEAVVGKEIRTPLWSSIQLPPLNIRDQTIVFGSTIVETATHVRARLFENDYLKPLFYEYMNRGARWICMPRPALAAGSIDSSYFALDAEERDALRDHHALSLRNLGVEMIFDGAQCLRLGSDVLVNVANANHELGFSWLKSNLGDRFNFHRLAGVADSHIDSLMAPLRPGLWLIRDRRYLSSLPKKFQGWDFLEAPPRKRHPYPDYCESYINQSGTFLDMNVLSIDEKTVIVNSLYPELIGTLEVRGFEVVPVRHRHGRLFGGGFHCFTLDVVRAGGMESYA
jgi:glycine amidinotransferase